MHTTTFRGAFAVSPPLRPEHAEYLRRFADTRRVKRDPEIAGTLPDPVREAAGLPVGPEGGYFVGGRGLAGQDRDPSLVDFNVPPERQPDVWCHWTPNADGDALQWSGDEKFREEIHWLRYLIRHFLTPWGHRLRGAVRYEGEDSGDAGTIYVDGEKIEVRHAADLGPPAWYERGNGGCP